MITIPLGLDEETVSKIDALVKKGVYKNRSEALRDQILKEASLASTHVISKRVIVPVVKTRCDWFIIFSIIGKSGSFSRK